MDQLDHRPTRSVKQPLWLVAALLLGVTAALAWQATAAYRDVRRMDARESDADRVTAVAGEAARQLVSFHAATAEADMKRLLDSGTDDFRTTYAAEVGRFRAAVARQKVNSEGEAVSAAVSSLHGKHAEVLVAASAAVTTKAARSPRQMYYRFNVGLVRQGDTWHVDKLEFVA
jgi:Mce-associated membrane protein